MIRNLVFDMGGVLLDYAPERYVPTLTGDREAAEAILRELFFGPEWPLTDEGILTDEEVVARVQARIPRHAQMVAQAMQGWPVSLLPISGMPELLGRLKEKGWPLYLLSNTSLRFYEFSRRFEFFGLFDGLLISAQEKLVKPNPEIFRRLCERFSLRAEECLFIDDREDNVKSAETLGFSGHPFRGVEELEAFLSQQGIL